MGRALHPSGRTGAQSLDVWRTRPAAAHGSSIMATRSDWCRRSVTFPFVRHFPCAPWPTTIVGQHRSRSASRTIRFPTGAVLDKTFGCHLPDSHGRRHSCQTAPWRSAGSEQGPRRNLMVRSILPRQEGRQRDRNERRARCDKGSETTSGNSRANGEPGHRKDYRRLIGNPPCGVPSRARSPVPDVHGAWNHKVFLKMRYLLYGLAPPSSSSALTASLSSKVQPSSRERYFPFCLTTS